ncbi:Ger(x)C family spore germination protein [Peribacillus kribbensis]|uniref:Ger(x)C family spore germination protein n=1 Tax=Peribacillus kribbensis TaxID=356658 RepID=UPI0004138E6E|nr:Ger(x)C family spore germination protein [Peribacillus kribbensis]
MKKIMIWIVILGIVVGGATVKTKVLEDLQLVTIYGYDYAGKNKIRGIVSTPVIPTTENTPPGSKILGVDAHTSKNSRQLLQSVSPKPLVIGRLNTALYSDKIAKKGLFRLLDTLIRDPSLGRSLMLAVVKGSVEDLLSEKYTMTETSSMYVSELMKNNNQSVIPKTSLHSFLNDYFEKGRDPFLPLLEKGTDLIRMKGIAFFKQDRYIWELPYAECFVFKMLYENFKNGMYEYKADGDYVTLENLQSKVHYHISADNKQVTIHVSLKGKLLDASGHQLASSKSIPDLEKTLSRVLIKKAARLENKFKKLNIDPLGIGDKARSKERHFNFEEWNKQYKNITFKNDVKVEITQSGAVD